MTDRDRLIELLDDLGVIVNVPDNVDDDGCGTYTVEGGEYIADHLLSKGVFILPEDLRGTDDFSISAFIEAMQMYKEKDRYIKLPCKVGDKIYMLVTRKTHSFVFEKGKKMLRVDNQHTFIKETYLTKLNFFKVIDGFGETVFLTKEEAEEKLKELNK